MNSRSWPELSSALIAGDLVLGKLVYAGRLSAIFEARDRNHGDAPAVFVQLFRISEGTDIERLCNRFGEARYMPKQHVVEWLKVGFDHTENLVYCVAPKPLAVLAQTTAEAAMPVTAALELVEDLIPALSYLHGEDLVFCSLRPEAVWKTEDGWKLADFSQLRLTGRGDPKELRAAIARYGDTPPEPYLGIVSPAWDIWSLGLLLQKVLAGTPGPNGGDESAAARTRQLRDGLPPPFQRIVRECLEPDPDARATLATIQSYLPKPADPPTPQTAAPPPPLQPEAPMLSPALGSPGETAVVGWFHKARKWSRARLVLVAAGLLGLLVGTVALMTRSDRPSRSQENAAVSFEADRINPRLDSKPVETLPAARNSGLLVANKDVRPLRREPAQPEPVAASTGQVAASPHQLEITVPPPAGKSLETQPAAKTFVPPPSNPNGTEPNQLTAILEPPAAAAAGAYTPNGLALPATVSPVPQPPAINKQQVERIRVGGAAKNGKLLRSVPPVYPDMARSMRLQGKVKFAITIGKDGHVRALRLISGNPTLIAAAAEAVRQWVYEPSLLNSEPVAVDREVEVTFSLPK